MKYKLSFDRAHKSILKVEHEKIKGIIENVVSNHEISKLKDIEINVYYCMIGANKISVSIEVVRPCINKKEFDNISFNGFAIMDLIKHGYRINGFDNAIFKKRNNTEIHLIKDF